MALDPNVPDTTTLLAEIANGNADAASALVPRVYDDLRILAARYLRQFPGARTLQPTALVHEAYLRMVGKEREDFTGRAHFMAVAAKVMRGLLVDHARRKDTVRHGGTVRHITWHEDLPVARNRAAEDFDILALDEALRALRELDDRKSSVVEMRIFGGMTIEETAAALGIARSTVTEDWRMARAWVARSIMGEDHR